MVVVVAVLGLVTAFLCVVVVEALLLVVVVVVLPVWAKLRPLVKSNPTAAAKNVFFMASPTGDEIHPLPGCYITLHP